jgi:hypothetical protein
MSDLLSLIAILSLVTYRVTRLFIEDSLFDKPRERWYRWVLGSLAKTDVDYIIESKDIEPFEDLLPIWRLKLYQLTTCPFCFSVWVAAFATLFTNQVLSVPLPLWVWVGSAAGAMIVWKIAEDA